jgi:four helix bundle protein
MVDERRCVNAEQAMMSRGTARRKGDDIAKRLELLALVVLDEVLPKLQRRWAGRHLAHQLVRSMTGAGSNDAEARGAESRADFVHKVGVACKELREAQYWLHLLPRSRCLSESFTDHAVLHRAVSEADELIAILTASVSTARIRNKE